MSPLLDAYHQAKETMRAHHTYSNTWWNAHFRAIHCLQVIAEKDIEAIPPLLDLLRASENSPQRDGVLDALGELKRTRLRKFDLPPLLDAIRDYYASRVGEVMTAWSADADAILRWYGVSVLIIIGLPDTVAPLIWSLQKSPKDDSAVPILIGLLEQASEDMEDFEFVWTAVTYLARIGTPLALCALRELADNPAASIEVRGFASMALELNEEYWQPIEWGEGTANVARFH